MLLNCALKIIRNKFSVTNITIKDMKELYVTRYELIGMYKLIDELLTIFGHPIDSYLFLFFAFSKTKFYWIKIGFIYFIIYKILSPLFK